MDERQRYDWHTAYSPDTWSEPLELVELPQGLALAWDFAANGGAPQEFAQCDVLYNEAPVSSFGWKAHYESLGVSQPMRHRDFIDLVLRQYMFRPGVQLLGNGSVKQLPSGIPVTPGGIGKNSEAGHAFFAWFGITPPNYELKTNHEVMAYLAERYECVGDIACGYGWTGRYFASAGKRFVLSDSNSRCMGWIRDHAELFVTGAEL